MIAAIFVGSFLLFGALIAFAVSLGGTTLPKTMSPLLLKVMLAAQCMAYLAVLLFMYVLIVRYYGRRFGEAVRWVAPRAGQWLYYILAGVALSFAIGLLSRLLPFPRTLPIDQYFQDRTSAWLMTIFGVSMAPLVEELFYRGFLYPVVARRLGVAAGTAITAAAFALMHSAQLAYSWGPLLVLFLVGLVFTIARIVTRSVVPGFLMHVGYNATLFSLLYVASDGFRHLEKALQ